MAKKSKSTVFFVKITGHQLVTVREKEAEEAHEYDRLKITMHGVGDDEKTRINLMVDPADVDKYPLSEKGEITFEIRQQRLQLESGS